MEMAPKAKKAPAKKSTGPGAAAANKNWETGLISAPFEEVCCFTEGFLLLNSGPFLSVLFYLEAKLGVILKNQHLILRACVRDIFLTSLLSGGRMISL